ncbi:MAG: 3-deoxy-7-phosphoheptulonate synthase [Acidobacteriota bacterium]|nr:3-deoxy-7-phosphoheptulonate synthase [Blastocatellia bacterium]MDW8411901.1 3-deoxy-7-phosphoheptulonate synthase [Acidobacteriota bacterium]
MIVIFNADIDPNGEEVRSLISYIQRYYPNIRTQVHFVEGALRRLTEVYLIGPTEKVSHEGLEQQPGVERVVRVSEKYRIIARHKGQLDPHGFTYNGLTFDQESLHVFPGLCAVDTRENVEKVLCKLHELGVCTARMGAYKPRTSPYDFQGHGRDCLAYVFELAGKYGIRVVAMEVLHENHIQEIRDALELAGRPTGVMLQIGTRNAQNFELLKSVGQQKEFPVLFKRGMGITLEESLNACEYIATEGNRNIIFCLRGVKTHLSEPHRNLVDFGHVPVIKRLTRLPVCIDPSHSVGRREYSSDGIQDIYHVTAQGIIAGANMVLTDFHPNPSKALCDGPQALLLEEMQAYLQDIKIVRDAYLKRRELLGSLDKYLKVSY